MPTYEYSCSECGYTFDLFHGMNENPDVFCPKCNGEVRRLISGGTGIIFKGSGFYVNDSKSRAGKTASERSADTDPEKTTSDAAAKKTSDIKPNGSGKQDSAPKTEKAGA